MILRKVVETVTYKPDRTVRGAFNILDTLECGHEIHNKGSGGRAKRRKCFECEGLRSNGQAMRGNTLITWNSETQMPHREPVWDIIEQEWASQGKCNSCGYHGILRDYPRVFTVNIKENRFEMACFADGDESVHKGVYIYYNEANRSNSDAIPT